MIKKTVVYENLDGKTESEVVYLNINMIELTELEFVAEKSISDILKEIGETPSMADALKTFKMFIRFAYGVKSPDSKKLLKSDSIWESFENSEPYSALLWEMLNDAPKAVDVIMGILPQKKIEELIEKDPESKKKYNMEMAKLKEQKKLLQQKAEKVEDIPTETEVDNTPELPDDSIEEAPVKDDDIQAEPGVQASTSVDSETLRKALQDNPELLKEIKGL